MVYQYSLIYGNREVQLYIETGIFIQDFSLQHLKPITRINDSNAKPWLRLLNKEKSADDSLYLYRIYIIYVLNNINFESIVVE